MPGDRGLRFALIASFRPPVLLTIGATSRRTPQKNGAARDVFLGDSIPDVGAPFAGRTKESRCIPAALGGQSDP